jgi:RimJ/RimL family protein N-acetyltransferase
MMPDFFQSVLKSDKVWLRPLLYEDFGALHQVANDPMIWEQHPNPDRWKESVFRNFFKGALDSGGAYIVIDTRTDKTIGSTRFYDYNPAEHSVFIGYSFIGKAYWGQGYNQAMKSLMLHHAFQIVDSVFFHVGIQNIRSQKAMEKLGAEKIRSLEVAYYGEPVRTNVEYLIRKEKYFHQK